MTTRPLIPSEEARFLHKGSIFSLRLAADHLCLKFIKIANHFGPYVSAPSNDALVPLANILSATCLEEGKLSTKLFSKDDTGKRGSLQSHCLKINFVTKKKGSRKWKLNTMKLLTNDALMCSQWCVSIMNKVKQYVNMHGLGRPKKLLVFINPYGGHKKAEVVYEKTVAPIFKSCGIHCEVIVTKYQNHARKFMETEDLSGYCGVVAVGGDGILSEIINGLLVSTQKTNEISLDVPKDELHTPFSYSKPDLMVGVIPAGSTNALCYSSQGVVDAETSALHIAVGDSHPLDMCSIHDHSGKLLQFSFAMTSYGFYGNVLKQSEHLRTFGPSRYDLAGVRSFMQLHSYEAEISYLPSRYEKRHGNVETDNSRCRHPCDICLGETFTGFDLKKLHRLNSNENGGNAVQSPHKNLSPVSGSSNCRQQPDVHSVESNSSQSSGDAYDELNRWKVIRGKFVVVSSAMMTCACDKSPHGLSPSAHLADGNTDLILVRQCSKLDFFRYLWSHIGSADRFHFPFVEAHRVTAFKYRSLRRGRQSVAYHPPTTSTQSGEVQMRVDHLSSSGQHQSCWNTDGEFISDPDIVLWVHRGLINMFSRGIEQ